MATLLGVTSANTLLRFDSATPASVQTMPITGIGGGQSILGTDIRPATGQLYALTADAGNVGRLYTIDTASGLATFQATLAADPADLTNPYTTLSGASFGVDFNPVPDRMRVVSNTGQDLRINVATGLVTTDTTLNPGTPGVVGVVYTNSFAGATTTTLYDIDATTDTLSIQNPPNNGTLVAVGPLGVDASDVLGFDIRAANNTAIAALTVGGTSGLYSINLTTGAATLIGNIGGAGLTGLALVPNGTLNFSAPVFRVVENQSFATITVTRVGGTDGAVGVSYATSAGTATPGEDYTNVSGTLNFASGDATPVAAGTRPPTIVFSSNRTQANASAKKTKSVATSPIAQRKVKFAHSKAASKAAHSSAEE